MRLWRSQRLLDGCCTFDSSFFEAIRRKLSSNITWVPGLAPAGDGSWEIHKINGERAVDLQPNVESPWVGCERGEMLLCLLAERVEEDVVVDGSKLWRVSDCESCPYDLWWWKLVKAKWENALTTDSSSSFLVQSQVFVPKWPFYPISTFTSFFYWSHLHHFRNTTIGCLQMFGTERLKIFSTAILPLQLAEVTGLLRIIHQTCKQY